jgi:hypothetical protein
MSKLTKKRLIVIDKNNKAVQLTASLFNKNNFIPETFYYN